MSIDTGPPPSNWLDDLLDAAFTSPGEWVSTEIPNGTTTSNTHNMLKARAGTRILEVTINDTRVYTRVRT